MLNILYIGIGGFLGSIARYLVSKFFYNYFPNFPLGTLIVNVSGSFFIAVIMYLLLNGKFISTEFKDFSAIGFIGAFTTMSTFAYESYRLVDLSDYFSFALNLFLNVFLCLLAIYFGKELAGVMSR